MANAVECSSELEYLAKKYPEIKDGSLENSVDYFIIVIPITMIFIKFALCSIIIMIICMDNGKNQVINNALSEFIGFMVNFGFSFICMMAIIGYSDKTIKWVIVKWALIFAIIIGSCLGVYNEIGKFN